MMMCANHDKPKAGELVTLLGLADGLLNDLPVQDLEALSVRLDQRFDSMNMMNLTELQFPDSRAEHSPHTCGPPFIGHFDEEVPVPEN